MAGNCNVACAEERVRVDPKTLLLVPIPQLGSLPLSQRRGAKAQTSTSVRNYAAEHPELATPNILWPPGSENPPNCVFFACHPLTPAVLTS